MDIFIYEAVKLVTTEKVLSNIIAFFWIQYSYQSLSADFLDSHLENPEIF